MRLAIRLRALGVRLSQRDTGKEQHNVPAQNTTSTMVRATAATSSAGYGGDLELEAQEWIEGVTGEAFEGGFEDSLRDGVKLCKLLNTIKPGAVRRVNTKEGQNKFKQMENISNFIRGCREIGVKEYSLFETVDLYEGKDVGLVVKCLVSCS